jgi:hypothetical protein
VAVFVLHFFSFASTRVFHLFSRNVAKQTQAISHIFEYLTIPTAMKE